VHALLGGRANRGDLRAAVRAQLSLPPPCRAELSGVRWWSKSQAEYWQALGGPGQLDVIAPDLVPAVPG
jgi:hypothetical protein